MTKELSRRRQARELALQVLFQGEFLESFDIAQSLNHFKGVMDAGTETYQYAERLAKGVTENKSQLDEKIEAHAANWKISRMALVDVNIMRIALYELLLSDNLVPPKVSIDEALELAKKYSTTESSKFINGILDQVIKNA